ncbi:MAG TPA: hypothetical protein V6C65_27755 [Allocoleopsis sp.]
MNPKILELLSEEEVQALRYYSDSVGYREIDSVLRGSDADLVRISEARGDSSDLEEVKSRSLKTVSLLSSAIKALPPYRGTVYRTLNISDSLAESIQPGEAWTETGFTSTSKKEPAIAPGKTLAVILSNSGRDISSVEKYPNGEILFDKGTGFVVLDKHKIETPEGGCWVLEMQEQGNLPLVKRDSESSPKKSEDLIVAKRDLAALMSRILSRGYRDGIDRMLDVRVMPDGEIQGLFRDGSKIIKFSWHKNSVYHKQVNLKEKKDSANEFERYSAVQAVFVRKDARRKGKQCKEGIPCGDTCIERDKECITEAGAIASPQEQERAMELAERVSVLQEAEEDNGLWSASVSPKEPPSSSPQGDELDAMTIRQLKTAARERGVRGYSEMTSSQLRESIRIADESPEQQSRVRRTLNYYQQEPIVARQYGLKAKSSEAEAATISAFKKWNRISRIARVADTEPKLATIAMGAVLTGMVTRQYMKATDKYRDGFPESAAIALERANKMPTKETDKENITFVVSSFQRGGSSAKEIIGEIKERGAYEDSSESDIWLSDEHEYLEFDPSEFKIDETLSPKKAKDGSPNPLHRIESVMHSVGAYLENFKRGRNDDAVELAAQIYAYANRRDPESGEYLNKDKKFNILAHGTGGNISYEAMEILARMNQPRSRSGKEVLDQINLVSIGTARFGATDRRVRERNLVSANDPVSILPKRSEKWVSEVKSGDVKDYIKSDRVAEEMVRAFGYYTFNQYERQEKVRRKKNKKKQSSQESQE